MDWFFAENKKPSNDFVDKFSDSKFKTNKWDSFAREIIQNSLDAYDSALGKKPVIVDFSFNFFTIDQIPGAKRILEVMELCLQNKDLNTETREKYKNGIKILNADKISCLKISDYNTVGVESGLDKSWGALVYDAGVSRKNRPGSAAGSHGVGKKVPFIISGINTVYYATKNDVECLFEGKTSLINWSQNGKAYDGDGWFGIVNKNNDRRNTVLPVSSTNHNLNIEPFFLRNDRKGTDVIIVGISKSAYDIDEAKKKIINAILENFFVAIDLDKLRCRVFGEEINKDTMQDIIKNYYISKPKNFGRMSEYSSTLRNGNLKDYYDAYFSEQPHIIPLNFKGKKCGYLNIYFKLGNQKNKKFYCIFREHGMKIKDVQYDSDQPFTAVVITKDANDPGLKNDEKLNFMLSRRENPAHDDFIIDDEQFPCDESVKFLIENIYKEIENFIKERTQIEVQEETDLDSLNDMLSIQGSISSKVNNLQKPKTKHKRHKAKKKSLSDLGKDYEFGVGGVGGSKTKDNTNNDGENKPAIIGDKFLGTIYKNFKIPPKFFHIKNYYILRFKTSDNSQKAQIKIQPVSVDGVITNVGNIVESAEIKGKKMEIQNNIIQNVPIDSNNLVSIKIKLKENYEYTLDCDMWLGDNNA